MHLRIGRQYCIRLISYCTGATRSWPDWSDEHQISPCLDSRKPSAWKHRVVPLAGGMHLELGARKRQPWWRLPLACCQSRQSSCPGSNAAVPYNRFAPSRAECNGDWWICGCLCSTSMLPHISVSTVGDSHSGYFVVVPVVHASRSKAGKQVGGFNVPGRCLVLEVTSPGHDMHLCLSWGKYLVIDSDNFAEELRMIISGGGHKFKG